MGYSHLQERTAATSGIPHSWLQSAENQTTRSRLKSQRIPGFSPTIAAEHLEICYSLLLKMAHRNNGFTH